jgi:hypothetical protein
VARADPRLLRRRSPTRERLPVTPMPPRKDDVCGRGPRLYDDGAGAPAVVRRSSTRPSRTYGARLSGQHRSGSRRARTRGAGVPDLRQRSSSIASKWRFLYEGLDPFVSFLYARPFAPSLLRTFASSSWCRPARGHRVPELGSSACPARLHEGKATRLRERPNSDVGVQLRSAQHRPITIAAWCAGWSPGKPRRDRHVADDTAARSQLIRLPAPRPLLRRLSRPCQVPSPPRPWAARAHRGMASRHAEPVHDERRCPTLTRERRTPPPACPTT